MRDDHTDRPAYEPPTVEDLGTLEELTQSGNNILGTDATKT